MASAPAKSVIDVLLGLQPGSGGQEAAHRFSVEGLTWGRGEDGALQFGIQEFEAASLRLTAGPLELEVGRVVLHKLVGQVRIDGGGPLLAGMQAASAEVSGVKVRGPLVLPASATTDAHPAATAWSLGPLATADGALSAKIADAHLLFDADVTVPIRNGQVWFNDATVEHVGPDSRMGVSRLGLYVDAPNGRSYLYQFPATPVAGVEYEQRGALLGGVSDRGKLLLQPFGEALLAQAAAGQAAGLTEQARLLFERTAVTGQLQLGDGQFAGLGVQADVTGRAQGRNAVQVHSEAVGRGLTAQMPALSVRAAQLAVAGMTLACDEITGDLLLRVLVDRTQLRFEFALQGMKLSGLRLGAGPPPAG